MQTSLAVTWFCYYRKKITRNITKVNENGCVQKKKKPAFIFRENNFPSLYFWCVGAMDSSFDFDFSYLKRLTWEACLVTVLKSDLGHLNSTLEDTGCHPCCFLVGILLTHSTEDCSWLHLLVSSCHASVRPGVHSRPLLQSRPSLGEWNHDYLYI